jgi:hypothetical protein
MERLDDEVDRFVTDKSAGVIRAWLLDEEVRNKIPVSKSFFIRSL